MHKKILLFLLLPLSGCSAMILSVGQEETSILYKGATMETVSQHLGKPIEKNNLVPPKPVNEELIPEIENNEYSNINTELFIRQIWNENQQIAVYPKIYAFYLYTYEYKGRIERKYDKGSVLVPALMTFGVTELLAIPYSIKEQTLRPGRTHAVSVWYDNTKSAVAYSWGEIRPESEQED
jgi:hypothetical protein